MTARIYIGEGRTVTIISDVTDPAMPVDISKEEILRAAEEIKNTEARNAAIAKRTQHATALCSCIRCNDRIGAVRELREMCAVKADGTTSDEPYQRLSLRNAVDIVDCMLMLRARMS